MVFGAKDEEMIRSYLLGDLSEDKLKALEERVMTDNEFSEFVLMIEDSLVEDYLDGRLKGRARNRFEKLLLSTPQGEEELRFTRVLKENIARDIRPKPVVKADRPWFVPRWAVYAATVLLAAVGIQSVRVAFFEPELNKGLSAMSKAFHRERPIEARITVLPYAARPNRGTRGTRGKRPEAPDSPELRRAEIALQGYAGKKPGAASFHALGCLYLAEGEPDKAIEAFDRALRFDSTSAKIHSDLGAAYLEKATTPQEGDPSRTEQEFSISLEHFNRALELDPNLLDARFNRALLYQRTSRFSQALDEWREYLTKDSNSSWADEARSNIRTIENPDK